METETASGVAATPEGRAACLTPAAPFALVSQLPEGLGEDEQWAPRSLSKR